jgi:hypothetical protein
MSQEFISRANMCVWLNYWSPNKDFFKKERQAINPYYVWINFYNYKPNKVGIFEICQHYKFMYIKAFRLGTHLHEGFQCSSWRQRGSHLVAITRLCGYLKKDSICRN